MIPATELLAFLEAVKSGDIRLEALYSPQDVYAGNVKYSASNGWSLVIFNDCNDYDYIDSVRTEDGREIDFDDIDADCQSVFAVGDIAWRCLGIPGYLKYMCAECGAEVKVEHVGPWCGNGKCDRLRNPPEPTRVKIKTA